MNKNLLTSIKQDYETPQPLFDELDSIFHFDLDVAASCDNAKCANYFTEEDDGLKQSWAGHSVWMNPPYGKKIHRWVKKAFDESQNPDTTIVCLIPARTDTNWFHDYCLKGDVIFIRGRLRFSGLSVNAPFPSMIVVFGKENR